MQGNERAASGERGGDLDDLLREVHVRRHRGHDSLDRDL
jgi:hypothetical protein